jgi:hypothetical protein
MAKLSLTRQWEIDHPNDKLCPRDPDSARAWRFARGFGDSKRNRVIREKYEAAMAEKRARESQSL